MLLIYSLNILLSIPDSSTIPFPMIILNFSSTSTKPITDYIYSLYKVLKKNGISFFPWFKSFFHSIINYFQFKWNQDTNSEYNDLFVLVNCFSSSYWINGQNDNTCFKPLYISKLLIISKNHNYDLCKFLVKEGNKQLIQSKVKDWKIYFNRDITSK